MFGANLEAARKAAGLTQWQLSRRTGVAHTVIVSLESGHTKFPSTDTARRLADALHTTIGALMDETLGKPDRKAEAVANSYIESADAFILASRAILKARRLN